MERRACVRFEGERVVVVVVVAAAVEYQQMVF
jgi:hypothetical protein